MTESKPKQIPPYGIRLPAELKERIQESAERNGRSLHGEIIYTLEEVYPVRPVPADNTEFLRALNDLRERLDEMTERAKRFSSIESNED